VRAAAIEQLKSRPRHDFVPLLLSGLSMPIESSFSVRTDAAGGVHYTHSLYREGQTADFSIDASLSTFQHELPGRDLVYRAAYNRVEDWTDLPYTRAEKIAAVSANKQRTYGAQAANVETQVAAANAASAAATARIIPVLSAVTEQDFATARQWWDWWQDYNEYYAGDRPVDEQVYSDAEHVTYGQPCDCIRYNPSCFVQGTPVWTKTGQRPIESLALGDLVLAQNVETGELKYKPVIGRTVRPPSPIIVIALDDEQLLTTLGHPFWVTGVGWRMAKELGDGAVLHGVAGPVRIRSCGLDPDAEAYNLVVADFNTYFVGASGVLVHDNTPRRSSRMVVPGVKAP
jgi:hypothetical protein